MIRAGFLSREDRACLIALAKDGSEAHRLARRAHALVLHDEGWKFQKVAEVLLLDDATIRAWHKLFVDVASKPPAPYAVTEQRPSRWSDHVPPACCRRTVAAQS